MSQPTLVRDLSFKPVPLERSRRVLSPAQIHDYNQRGFIKGLPVFTREEIAGHRQAFDRLLAAYQARGMDGYQVNSCQATCGSVYDLATDRRVTDAIGDILGDAFACWSTHYFCKLPGDPKIVSWHQDAPYWPFTPARTVTMWLAIDDVDAANGAMRVIPGSHLRGEWPMRHSRSEENNALWLTLDGAEDIAPPVTMELPAGHASLHSDMLVHGSLANTTDRRRCAVALRYCTLDVRSDQQWNTLSILIRGSDPTGHWGHVHHRPQGEDPFLGDEAIGSN